MKPSTKTGSQERRERYTADLEDLRSQFSVFIEILNAIRENLRALHKQLDDTHQMLKKPSQSS